jgi:hypothetical protein
MNMRAMDGIGNWVLVLMATFSLILMIAAFRVDMIVNQDLYSYGLQFSHRWAVPYWDMIRTVFVMAWLNIIAAVSFQLYRISVIHKAREQIPNKPVEKTIEEKWESVNAGIQKSADPDVLGEGMSTSEAANNQKAKQHSEEEVQIVPYESRNCEQSGSKDSEQTEGQKETETSEVDTPKEEKQPEGSEEQDDPQGVIRWADESDSNEKNVIETEPL